MSGRYVWAMATRVLVIAQIFSLHIRVKIIVLLVENKHVIYCDVKYTVIKDRIMILKNVLEVYLLKKITGF